MTLRTGQKRGSNEIASSGKAVLAMTLGKKGFTLIELGLVIAILSIILLVAAANFRKLAQRMEMDATGYKLYGLFSYARAESITKGLEYKVTIDKKSGGYMLGFEGREPEISGAIPASLKVSNISANEVLFRPDGTAAPFSITVEGPSGRSIRLKILPFTGRVQLSES